MISVFAPKFSHDLDTLNTFKRFRTIKTSYPFKRVHSLASPAVILVSWNKRERMHRHFNSDKCVDGRLFIVYIKQNGCWCNFQPSCKNHPTLNRFSFSVLTGRPCNWSGKHDPQPITSKIKTNQDLFTHVFSFFVELTVFCCCFVVVTVFFLFHFDF